jgi:hypothetical protein
MKLSKGKTAERAPQQHSLNRSEADFVLNVGKFACQRLNIGVHEGSDAPLRCVGIMIALMIVAYNLGTVSTCTWPPASFRSLRNSFYIQARANANMSKCQGRVQETA